MQHVAQGLASLGRGEDKMLVHMTPGEVRGLQQFAMAHGGSLTINPHTGLPEAGFLSSLLPMALGAGAMLIPGMQPLAAAALVGGGYGLATGSLAKGLQAGMGAYGGAGLGDALAGFGGEMGANMGPQLPAAAAPTPATAAELARAGFTPEGSSLFGVDPSGLDPQAIPGYGTQASVQPLGTPAPLPSTQPIASMADLATNQNQMPGMDALRSTKADYMLSGARNAFDRPMDFLQTKGVPTALASAAAPMVSNTLSGMIQPQGIKGIAPQIASAPNFPNYRFQQTRNPNWGQPGESYYTQQYIPLAAGGQVPSPSLPLDLSQNYPGSNITKSSYASLPSTDSQEVVDGYGPKINPFTGAEGMAAGGLADFKMYDVEPQIEETEHLQKILNKRRKSKDDEEDYAHGGIASLPEYAAGGKLLRGPGDGMSDDIPAVIKGPKPQRAALADGEFVVPADVVSHLGNGSTEAGAKRLYSMMDKVRHARTGNKKQGRQINAEKYIPA